MLEVKGLEKSYGSVKAVAGIDFHVDRGELYGFLGPNGAGKTTTIKILTGLAKADSGTAKLAGADMLSRDPSNRLKVGVVHQHVSLDQDLTAWENLDIYARFYSLGAALRKQRIEEVLEFIDLGDRVNDQVKKFSGGMKRRLMIGRAMLHKPELIFMDEPTVGLDPSIRRKVWSLIKAAQAEGATVFLTTHYIEEAEFLCQRVAFINEGRILTVDTPDALKASLGEWAVDVFEDRDIKTMYFDGRDEAEKFVSGIEAGTIRRINLEDVFLSITGRGIDATPAGGGKHGAHS